MVAVRGARGGGALPLAATRVDTPHRRLHDAAAWSAGGAGDLTVIITRQSQADAQGGAVATLDARQTYRGLRHMPLIG
jgi:hypothetical protein